MPTPLQEGRATRKSRLRWTLRRRTVGTNATDYVKGNQVATGAPRPCTPDPSRCPTSRSAGVVTLSGATTPVGRDQSGTEWRLREASTSTFRVRSAAQPQPRCSVGASGLHLVAATLSPGGRPRVWPLLARPATRRGSYSISRDGTQRAPPHRTRQPRGHGEQRKPEPAAEPAAGSPAVADAIYVSPSATPCRSARHTRQLNRGDRPRDSLAVVVG